MSNNQRPFLKRLLDNYRGFNCAQCEYSNGYECFRLCEKCVEILKTMVARRRLLGSTEARKIEIGLYQYDKPLIKK